MAYLKQNSPSESGEAAGCIFCRKAAAQDDTAEHVLYRAEHCYVTLNLYPYNNGHLLVAPYQHIDRLEALSPEAAAEMMAVTQQALIVLRQAYRPDGFNIGINQGAAAGAGIAEHLHQHIVPRWAGDTNFLSTVAQTRTIPEWIDETYRTLKVIWDGLGTST